MTTLHHLPGSIVAVEGLPEGACDFQLDYPLNESYLFFDGVDFAGDSVELPYGTKYEILGWSDDEAVARQVVDMHENGTYWNYIGIWGGFTTAKGSLQSLLRSVGCESDRVLLLKKID